MARCLPFPPPGYVWNGMSGEALLELIKARQVQREGEKAEKKEEIRKRRKKEREEGEILQKKRSHRKRHKRLRSNEGNEGRSENQGKNDQYATLGMDRSSLSDELNEQPIPDTLYASSDNSQSIQKKRTCRTCIESQNHGSVVQILFLSQKQKTPEALSGNPDCSTGMIEMQFFSEFNLSNDIDVQEQELVPPPLRLRKFHHSSKRVMDEKSEMTLTESLYRELAVNWNPHPLQIEHFDVGDEEWLFERKPARSDILDKSNGKKDVMDGGNSTSRPHDHCFLYSPETIDSGVQKKLGLDPTPVKEQISSTCGVPSTDSHELAPASLKVLHNSFSQEADIDNEKFEMAPKSGCTCSQFGESVVNRVPNSLHTEHFDIGDKRWLFQTKQARRDKRDTSTASSDALIQGNCTPYPHAQYLPKANIYALPYTIPY